MKMNKEELRQTCYNLAHARYLMSSELPHPKLRDKYMEAWAHILKLIETSEWKKQLKTGYSKKS